MGHKERCWTRDSTLQWGRGTEWLTEKGCSTGSRMRGVLQNGGPATPSAASTLERRVVAEPQFPPDPTFAFNSSKKFTTTINSLPPSPLDTGPQPFRRFCHVSTAIAANITNTASLLGRGPLNTL